MEDPGSTQDFVTHDLAEKLHLPGHYQSGGRTRRGHTNESLQDVSIGHAKQKLQVEAICMDSLLAISPAPETEYLVNRFPEVDHMATRRSVVIAGQVHQQKSQTLILRTLCQYEFLLNTLLTDLV